MPLRNQTNPSKRLIPPPVEALPFWSPHDRPGPGGAIDRTLRQQRLWSSITLSDTQLREVLLKMCDVESGAIGKDYLLHCPDFVDKYVPADFEGTRVPPETAAQVLRHAVRVGIAVRLRGIKGFCGVLWYVEYKGRPAFCLPWYKTKPRFPPCLTGLPNVIMVEFDRQPSRYGPSPSQCSNAKPQQPSSDCLTG